MLSNISDVNNLQGGIPSMNNFNELTSMNVVNNVRARQASQSAASSEERELFAIFSGLRVVTMTPEHQVRDQATGQSAATTTFEGDGAANLADRPDRPYRRSLALALPPGSYPQTRLSSV